MDGSAENGLLLLDYAYLPVALHVSFLDPGKVAQAFLPDLAHELVHREELFPEIVLEDGTVLDNEKRRQIQEPVEKGEMITEPVDGIVPENDRGDEQASLCHGLVAP